MSKKFQEQFVKRIERDDAFSSKEPGSIQTKKDKELNIFIRTDYIDLSNKLDILVNSYIDDNDDRLLKIKTIFNSVLKYLTGVDFVNIDIANTSIFNLKLENQYKRECVKCLNQIAYIVSTIKEIENNQNDIFNSVYFDTALLDITDSFYEVRILKSKLENLLNLDAFI